MLASCTCYDIGDVMDRGNACGFVPYILTLCNIGIKHAFLCINICWAPREVLKPGPETFCRSKTLEKMLLKVLFSCTHSGAEKHVTCERFENAAFRANTKLNVILTSQNYVCFCARYWWWAKIPRSASRFLKNFSDDHWIHHPMNVKHSNFNSGIYTLFLDDLYV